MDVILLCEKDPQMSKDVLNIRPISGALGAEVYGINLDQSLNPTDVKNIRQALLNYLVIFFRDQSITPSQQLEFAKHFGELVEYPLVRGLDKFPEIVPVVKLPNETINFGGLWHSDTTYLEKPPMGGILVARELPPYGGDTLFSNMYLAYESLSKGMRNLLKGLTAVNSSAKARVTETRRDRVDASLKDSGYSELKAEHPVIRTHPETGRKALYVNSAHTVRFKGMTEMESAPLLNFLYNHQTRPEFTCCFRWHPGSIAFWDNRCTQHNPVNDYHGHKRVMHRISIAGDKPSYIFSPTPSSPTK